ncbi:32307_t:CDS:2, partial [Gigaspora margarita]
LTEKQNKVMSTSSSSVASLGVMFSVPQVAVDASPSVITSMSSLTPDDKRSLLFDKAFQEMFEESGFEIYKSRESFVEYVQTEQRKEAKNWRIAMTALIERVRDRYWNVEEMGNIER